MGRSLKMINKYTMNRESLVDSLYTKNQVYQSTYDNLLSQNLELNRKLKELLICTHDIAKETEQLEHLIQLNDSPMQKVLFVKKGLLEGSVLERIQYEVDDIIIEQNSTITNLRDTLTHMNQHATNIETKIEENKIAMCALEGSISENRDEIIRLKVEIEKMTKHLRTS